MLFILMLIPIMVFSQIKGKKSKNPYQSSQGTEFKVGDIIQLKKASNGNHFAYAYIKKSSLNLKTIANVANSVRDVKSMNVSNVNNTVNTVNKVNAIANSELVSGTMNQLMNQAVSESYVAENALSAAMEGSKFKIKQFKVFTDKDTGDQIVHAIAKGSGKNVAILLDFAEKTGEL